MKEGFEAGNRLLVAPHHQVAEPQFSLKLEQAIGNEPVMAAFKSVSMASRSPLLVTRSKF